MEQQIKRWISHFVGTYQDRHHTETAWRKPVVGYADASDPLFETLRSIVSPSHALPSDIVPGAKAVIAYFIPFEKEIAISNIPNEESSREWDYAYIETNMLLTDLNKDLCSKISAVGHKASLLPPTYNYDPEKLISDWSHRSAAFIAGIGKFGLHNMLITEQGCCGRLGSVITDLPLKPTERHEGEYCLYKTKGICKKCVARCVNQAFLSDGDSDWFDRKRCNEQIYEKIIPHYPIGDGDTCGKCMCGVPCSFKYPIV